MLKKSAARRSARASEPLSVRTRVLVAVSMLSVLSMLLAGVVAYGLERQRIDNRVDHLLSWRHSELVALTQRGTDPTTGVRLTSTHALLRAAMQLAQAGEHEGGMALVNNRIAWTAPPGVLLRPEADPDLVAHIRSLDRARVVVVSLNTPKTTYRYIVVPVEMEHDPNPGRFVWVVDLQAEHAQLDQSYATYVLVGLAALLLVGLVTWLLIGQLLEPISWVRQTAQEINETDLSRRIPVRGKDDLAELTLTVNAMLDRLESTFEAQRDLYDDVGHELRTPLTVLRGHLEVMNPRDEFDVERTRRRVISEVERMARLVEDLITLAKTDRPDFVRLQPVDVALLTDETLEKARALGDRRWVLEELADVPALLDPQRIAQALLELARNAVKFSEPESPISMGSAADADHVRFWVRDTGRGIPEDQMPNVVERFSRGGVRGVEGSGLGLAIVTSIAEAHAGRLIISSTFGVGSTVTLEIPIQTPPGAITTSDEEVGYEDV